MQLIKPVDMYFLLELFTLWMLLIADARKSYLQKNSG